MELSNISLVKRQVEFLPATDILKLPADIYGIYVLFMHQTGTDYYNVLYVGLASSRKTSDARTMLEEQRRINGARWTHFSVYELWEKIDYEDEVETERLFERIYKRDAKRILQLSRSKPETLDENAFIAKELFFRFVREMAEL